MPKPGTNIRFENHHKQLKAPYIIYADFESIIPKIEGPALDPTKSGTQQTAHHEACGFSYMVVRSDGQPSHHSSTVDQTQPNTSWLRCRWKRARSRRCSKTQSQYI